MAVMHIQTHRAFLRTIPYHCKGIRCFISILKAAMCAKLCALSASC